MKQYAFIIWKRIWIPVVLLVLVAGISYAIQQSSPIQYSASMRFIVGVEPERVPNQFNYDGYYTGVASEFVTDDFSVVVTSYAFAADVNRHLAKLDHDLSISPGVIQGIFVTEKQHRILSLNLTWHDPAQLKKIGQAIATTLNEDGPKYLTQLSSYGGVITMIDPPSAPAPVPASLIEQLNLPIRLLLALGVGIGLTFLIEYLDDTVRKKEDVEQMGLVVLAEVEGG